MVVLFFLVADLVVSWLIWFDCWWMRVVVAAGSLVGHLVVINGGGTT